VLEAEVYKAKGVENESETFVARRGGWQSRQSTLINAMRELRE
jgi:hypothetical protein